MTRTRLAIALVAILAFASVPAIADYETVELDPLSEKDLSSFKVEGDGEWGIDNVTDLIYTLIVCPKAPDDTSLLFIGKTFKQGFQLRLEVMGGSRNKALDILVVPTEGERIVIPFSRRHLAKKGWHDVVLTVEDGKAHVDVDDKKGDEVDVPKGVPLTFALRLDKRAEATFRKPKVRYLIVNEPQMAPEEGFVRIFDGKTLDGWDLLPQGVEAWKVGDENIQGKVPDGQQEVNLVFAHARFRNFVMKFRASGDTRNLIVIGRPGIQNQYPATYETVSNYFPGDREWNDVTWSVQGKTVSLEVNGSKVWTKEAPNDSPIPPVFALVNNGQARLRDIRVKGELDAVGPTWERYAKESGAATGGAPSGEFGGRGNDQPGNSGGATGFKEKVLFDGSSLDDWQFAPASGVWELVKDDKKFVGLTLDKTHPAEILYGKLVFFEYHLTLKIQKGTVGATFIAKRVPKDVADKPEAVLKLEDSWFTEPWNEFDAWCRDGLLKVKVNGKEVYSGKVPTEQGFLGFRIAPNSAIGVMDVVFTRPE